LCRRKHAERHLPPLDCTLCAHTLNAKVDANSDGEIETNDGETGALLVLAQLVLVESADRCVDEIEKRKLFACTVLAMKKVDYEYRAVNLLQGEQTSDNYQGVNPMNTVPSLTLDGVTVNDSMAIMEMLEVSDVVIRCDDILCRRNIHNRQCCRKMSSIERACVQYANLSSPLFNLYKT
jgi:hypothetical protein